MFGPDQIHKILSNDPQLFQAALELASAEAAQSHYGDRRFHYLEFILQSGDEFAPPANVAALERPRLLESPELDLPILVRRPIGVDRALAAEFVLPSTPSLEISGDGLVPDRSSLLAYLRGLKIQVPSEEAGKLIKDWKDSRDVLKFAEDPGTVRDLGEIVLVALSERDFRLALNPGQIVRGLFYLQHHKNFPEDGTRLAPALFERVEDHMRQGPAGSSPIAWAAARVQIAIGYAAAIGESISIDQIERPYRLMASELALRNYIGEDQSQSGLQHFLLNEHSRGLLEAARSLSIKNWGCELSPEATAFILGQESCLTISDINSEALAGFVRDLPHLTANGFRITQVNQLIETACSHGMQPNEAVRFAVELARQVFSGEKPWWFKPDVDLCVCFGDSQSRKTGRFSFDPKDQATALALAACAHFAFPEAVPLYVKAGEKLAGIEGVDSNSAIEFTAAVTRNYGIGNFARARRVINFATQLMRETPQEQRQEVLSVLASLVHQVRPKSEIMGVLESTPNASFSKPGLSFLFEPSPDKKLVAPHEIGIVGIRELCRAIDSQDFAELVRKPGRIIPKALAEVAPEFLGPEIQIATPAPEKLEPRSGPLNRVIGFYQQLQTECGELDQWVAGYYFGVCALKFPDPFKPWPGFLGNLHTLADRGLRQMGLEGDPHDSSGMSILISQPPELLIARRLCLVPSLLDLHLRGICSQEMTQQIFDSLAASKGIERLRKHYTETLDVQKPLLIARLMSDSRPNEKPALNREQAEKWFAEFSREQLDRKLENVQSVICKIRLLRLQGVIEILDRAQALAENAEQFESLARHAIERFIQPINPELLFTAAGQPTAIQLHESNEKVGWISDSQRQKRLGQLGQFSQVQTFLNDFQAAIDVLTAAQARAEVEGLIEFLSEQLEQVYSGERSNDSFAAEANCSVSSAVASVEYYLGLPDGSTRSQLSQMLSQDFGLIDFLDLLPHMAAFDKQALPVCLAAKLENPLFADVLNANQITSRLFTFAGARILQHPEFVQQRVIARHGRDSMVNLNTGLTLYSSALPHNSDPSEFESNFRTLVGNLPEFLARVDQWRRADVPLGPFGGRLHVSSPISDTQVQFLAGLWQVDKTPFRTIHSNTSLILPGAMSRAEMRFFVFVLALEGLLDPTKAEFQAGVTGRLSPEYCAVLGSTRILGTIECPRFTPQAFMSNQRNNKLTGARMVAYDAYPESKGERKNFELPFMVACNSDGSPTNGNLTGRTDVLGCWHINWTIGTEDPTLDSMDDLDLVHYVGGALRQVQYGGPLAEVGKEFLERHKAILKAYGLGKVLDADWVYLREHDAYTTPNIDNHRHFEEAVRPCMEAHFAQAAAYADSRGIVFEVRENVARLIAEVAKIRERILVDPQWAEHVNALRISKEL